MKRFLSVSIVVIYALICSGTVVAAEKAATPPREPVKSGPVGMDPIPLPEPKKAEPVRPAALPEPIPEPKQAEKGEHVMPADLPVPTPEPKEVVRPKKGEPVKPEPPSNLPIQTMIR
jgi:hypothetical protein